MLQKLHNTERLDLYGDATGTYTPFTLRWYDDATAQTPRWDIERDASNNLQVYNHATSTQTAWFAPDDVLHVQDIAIEGPSSIDAGSLDGLDSAQFVRSDTDDTIAADLNVTGTLSEAGASVLTTTDEGTGGLNAGELEGATLAQTRPTITDDGTAVLTSPTAIDAGQYLQATDDGDGTLTLDALGGNAVGATQTASGDDTTTTFTLTHSLGAAPASVDVTPTTSAAAAPFHVSAVRSGDLDVTYASAPPTGTDNLAWHVTAVGNDGSGKHAVEVQTGGSQLDLADTFNFTGGLDVTNPTDGTVAITSPPGVDVEDDATSVVSGVEAIDFAGNLDVTDDGDSTVTVAGSDTYPSVSNSGSVVEAAPTDIATGDRLSAVGDGDGTVTLHANADAETLDGAEGSQYLRADVAATHDATLAVTTLDGANPAGRTTVQADLATDPGVGLFHSAGSSTHRLRTRRDGLQALTDGANLPTDYGLTLGGDATLAFVETDNDRVAGWVDTNTASLTMTGGVRVGDAGGAAQAALDVRGTAAFNENPVEGFRVETRTDDPSNPALGRLWIRSDLV